jgi:hypothetical protein
MLLANEQPPTTSLTFRDRFEGRLNVPDEYIPKQIRKNIRRILPQVMMHPPNDYKVALLCGGPSIAAELKTIKGMVKRGYKIACVNNTYNWELEQGLTPSVYVQHDARESNARFVSKPVKKCKYLLCAQVHPVMFDALDGYDVRIWHAGGAVEKKICDKYYMGRWMTVPGGTTIGTRALFLLYSLGVRTVRVYGMDSCYGKGKEAHHAYKQAENDEQQTVTITVGRRKFKSTPWMIAQLDEMLQMAGRFPPDLKVSFEGDGLLQYVINETSKRGKVPSIKME